MKYGFVLPHGNARIAADFAQEAEQAGWDGFFVWEPLYGVDAWVSLAAAAMRTELIRLGTMISPVSRMRPWKLASEALTLDHLSKGRVILSVGLGALDSGFTAFGEIVNRKLRAERLDEGLEIVTRLWRGQPFNYEGKHYSVKFNDSTFQMPVPPPPAQQPHIPIWVVGAWPSEKSLARALQYDGLLPNVMGEDGKVRMSPATPGEVHQIRAYIDERHGNDRPFDIVVEGETPADNPLASTNIIEPYIQAGATWWIEARWSATNLDDVLLRLRSGPPKV